MAVELVRATDWSGYSGDVMVYRSIGERSDEKQVRAVDSGDGMECFAHLHPFCQQIHLQHEEDSQLE